MDRFVVVKPKDNHHYLLVDTSYLIFYRYHAAIFWFKKAHPEGNFPEDYAWSKNTLFVEKFHKMFYSSLAKIRKQFRILDANVIFCVDSARDTLWRAPLLTTYKSNRPVNSDIGGIFQLVFNTIIPDLQKFQNCKVIKIPHAEADDIVGIIARYLQLTYPSGKAIIVANDHDYLQVLSQNHTFLYALPYKDIGSRVSLGNPEHDLLLKILMGDKSDNIPPCFPKCGKKTALSLIRDEKRLGAKLAENAEYRHQFEHNSTMIDFRSIPNEIQSKIVRVFQYLFPEAL